MPTDSPHTFADADGRTWTPDVDLAAVRRVRLATGVRVGDLAADGFAPLEDLLADDERFVDVLFAVCRPQAERDGVTAEQFGASLGRLKGDGLEAVRLCFVRALSDFFPSRQSRLLTALTAKSKAVTDLALETLTREAEAIDPEAFLAGSTSSSSATSSPASAGAATPAAEPSAS